MSDPFESSRRKLARAKDHLAELKREVLSFIQHDPCDILTEPHPDKPEHVVYKLCLTKQLPDGLSEITGDVVDNLRSALDHAMYAVSLASGCTKPLNAYFPFSRNATNFEANLKGRCADVPQEIYPLLRTYEPYQGGSKLLWALNQVCIANKHKLLVPIGASTFSVETVIEGTGFVSMPYTPIWDRTKNEMVMLTAEYGVKLDGHFKFGVYVAFGEIEGVDGQPALETLEAFVGMVETIINEVEAEARRIGLIK
jgi:hypothetical protein